MKIKVTTQFGNEPPYETEIDLFLDDCLEIKDGKITDIKDLQILKQLQTAVWVPCVLDESEG